MDVSDDAWFSVEAQPFLCIKKQIGFVQLTTFNVSCTVIFMY